MTLRITTNAALPPIDEQLQTASLGSLGDFFHRGTKADIGVMNGVFRVRSYALGHMATWPGVATRANSMRHPLIIDLGANIGASPLFFKVQVPAATVVAVEPDPGNFTVLKANVERFTQIVAMENAIASEPGTVTLSDPDNGGWAICASRDLVRGAVVGTVEAITIQQILEAHPTAEPFVLKIDIEGAEDDLFRGDTSAISRFPIVVVELHDRLFLGEGQQVSRSFLEWHVSQDRDFHQHGENTFSIDRRLRTAGL